MVGLVATVLVIETEAEFRVALATALRGAGYTAMVASTGQSGLDTIMRGGIDLVISEYVLPDFEGSAFIQAIKSDPMAAHIPLLIVSGQNNQVDRIDPLELGAEDYVGKPVSRREMVLRTNIVMRRHQESNAQAIIEYDSLIIEAIDRRARVDEEDLQLTPIEFRLLSVLAARPNQVQSRQALLAEVWGMQSYLETRTGDVHIKRLRKKLGRAADYIHTVRGIGYRFSGDRLSNNDVN